MKDLKDRTLDFTVAVLDFISKIPENRENKIFAGQLIRSASSIGANYRAAKRSRSQKEFISRLKIVEEEADETIYWLTLIQKRNIDKNGSVIRLLKEANELLAIIVKSILTAKSKLQD